MWDVFRGLSLAAINDGKARVTLLSCGARRDDRDVFRDPLTFCVIPELNSTSMAASGVGKLFNEFSDRVPDCLRGIR